ncbi:MAG: hypothetical protein WCB71_15425 [Aestuariivirga sp.]
MLICVFGSSRSTIAEPGYLSKRQVGIIRQDEMDIVFGFGNLVAVELVGRKTGTLIFTAGEACQQENGNNGSHRA